jgi:hypothetical protein
VSVVCEEAVTAKGVATACRGCPLRELVVRTVGELVCTWKGKGSSLVAALSCLARSRSGSASRSISPVRASVGDKVTSGVERARVCARSRALSFSEGPEGRTVGGR